MSPHGELELRRDREVDVTPPSDIMSVIAQAVQGGVDVEKMERLLAMKERMEEQERKQEFAEALHAIQSKRLRVWKRKKGKNAAFAPLEDIDEKLAPLLSEYGLTVSFTSPRTTDGYSNIDLIIMHRNGHSEIRSVVMPVDDIGTNSTGSRLRPRIQDHSSTFSYSRRTLLKLAFNVVETDEDDDGEGGEALAPITQDQADTIRDKTQEYGLAPDDRRRVLAFASQLQGKQLTGLAEIRKCDYPAVIALIDNVGKAKR